MDSMERKIRINFVCHGNICRSPTAEFVFKFLAAKAGLSDKFFVTSTATSSEEIFMGVGNPVYPPARQELLKHGIDCGDKRAVKLVHSDYEKYDYFFCMDENNRRNALAILGFDKDKKVHKLMEFTGFGGNVSDPWYSGDFKKAYDDIYKACEILLQKL